jgi:uncharacterized membrane protein
LQSKNKTIQKGTKNIISYLFVIAVLFPLTIQFSHALKKHNHAQDLNTHQVQMSDFTANCTIFHYQLNYNTIDFSSDFSFLEKTNIEEKNYAYRPIKNLFHYPYKSSRAPPHYC